MGTSPSGADVAAGPGRRATVCVGAETDRDVVADAPDELRFAEVTAAGEVSGTVDDDAPAVLVLDDGLAGDAGSALAGLPEHVAVIAVGPRAEAAAESAGRLFLALDEPADGPSLRRAIRAAVRYSASLVGSLRAASEAARIGSELRELNRIGMALMSERDPDRLLGMILTHARTVTTSDAGSLYLVEEDDDGADRLRFRLAQNDSLPDLPTPDFTLSIDQTSVAGYAASTGEPLRIEDAYEIPDEAPYSFNRSFDEEHGYRAKSMLVVPMLDQRDRIVGVLQLINRKRDADATIRGEDDARESVVPYTGRDVEVVSSLAGQAAVSIENGRLYQDIENLFEGFIKAAVTAIDQRDPATSGHSVRVTELTCDLAKVVDAVDEGRFADVHFDEEEMKQLRYAGLLHDFGKVGVREEVLIKQKKLPPTLRERVEARFDLIRQTLRARAEAEKASWLAENGRDGYEAYREERDAELARELERVDRYRDAVREANEPRPLPEESEEILDEVHGSSVAGVEGEEIPFLTDEEMHYLQIEKGSLDRDEIKQIQSHVVHSYDFLQEIPWTDELQRIDEIVIGHHEKLDGSGYPRGVEGDDIPLETRMMTVADIFDALTASDRPYKKAMPVEKALEILGWEAEGGQLDPDLVELFRESRVYERVLETDWREL